jgi:hypothetical protein
MPQIEGVPSMLVSTVAEPNWSGPQLAVAPFPGADQTERIQMVFGLTTGIMPKVDEDTLAQYYTFLATNLSLPFTAYYPQPMNAGEQAEFRCTVVELLDPAEHLGDEFDGIFCKVRKGTFEVNLPLIELNLPPSSPQFQLIEDYWYWFWNWR